MDDLVGSSGSLMKNTATTTSDLSSSSWSIFVNYPLISALVAFAIAQFIKFFTTWYKERRWDLKQLIGSGGMPSSHSATVTALAAAVGFYDGFGGSLFATALILACVVMYDAFGVRLHAGRQAEVCCSPSLPPTPTTETHSHVLILWIVICLSLLVMHVHVLNI
ncbi:hypothetical protein CsSME_00021670 [Camellia sinensis var. sinensis]